MKLLSKYIIAFLLLAGACAVYALRGSPPLSIILDFRIPRIMIAVITGGTLAVCGALMQGILQNPLADPYLLGISGGAVLGAVISSTLFQGNIIVSVLLSFAGGITAFLATMLLSGMSGNRKYSMIISGIMISSLTGALVVVIHVLSSRNSVELFYTLMGSLNVVLIRAYYPVYTGIAAFVLLLVVFIIVKSRELEIISSGHDIAFTSGIDVKRIALSTLIAASFAVSAVVAFTGIIGFIGIMVPHIIRRFVPVRHMHIFILSFLGGAVMLILSDMGARMFTVSQIPVGVITSILGIPFFLYILRGKHAEY